MIYGSYWTEAHVHCPQCEKDYDEQQVIVYDGIYTWKCPVCKYEKSVELA